MKKIVIFLFVPFILSSQSFKDEFSSGLINLNSDSDFIYILGVSSRQIYRSVEIEKAKDNALLQIAYYYGVEVKQVHFEQRGTSVADYLNIRGFDIIEPEILDFYRENLKFDQNDVYVSDLGTFVKFRFPRNQNYKLELDFLNEKPIAWLFKRPISNNGFTVMGFSEKRMWVSEQFNRCIEEALLTAGRMLLTNLETGNNLNRFGNFNYTAILSETFISGFHINQVYFDPKTNGCYILVHFYK